MKVRAVTVYLREATQVEELNDLIATWEDAGATFHSYVPINRNNGILFLNQAAEGPEKDLENAENTEGQPII